MDFTVRAPPISMTPAPPTQRTAAAPVLLVVAVLIAANATANDFQSLLDSRSQGFKVERK